VVAEHADMNKNHIGKLSQGIERNDILIHGIKCRTLDIVQYGMSDEFKLFSNAQGIHKDPEEKDPNYEILIEEMVNQRRLRKVELLHFSQIGSR
jgi:hypothetical protein